ncbi:MAG: hypothetical protein ACFHWX_19355 [Bacteroidota bacterium]
MITVFIVLLLVYGMGNLLIRIVNTFSENDLTSSPESGISKQKIAAINAAVEVFTEGAGSVTSIKKIKE